MSKKVNNDKNPDEIIRKLSEKIKEKKKVLDSIENPSYKTNLSFGYDPTSSARINLHTINNLQTIVEITSFLLDKSKGFEEASKLLDIPVVEFKWQGYSLNDWINDLKARASKITVEFKRKEFKILEEKLDGLISTEQRRLLELEAIEKSLED